MKSQLNTKNCRPLRKARDRRGRDPTSTQCQMVSLENIHASSTVWMRQVVFSIAQLSRRRGFNSHSYQSFHFLFSGHTHLDSSQESHFLNVVVHSASTGHMLVFLSRDCLSQRKCGAGNLSPQRNKLQSPLLTLSPPGYQAGMTNLVLEASV